ncbi:hypothetical protein YC2023_017462 [Brassica napus]|uniref:(rape) hypothetical protein n=1 Tax=Brassica napus TaxID=3708 RepID=A0A816KB82_BRANA|nr:unnamed protein product [Brassica napus]
MLPRISIFSDMNDKSLILSMTAKTAKKAGSDSVKEIVGDEQIDNSDHKDSLGGFVDHHYTYGDQCGAHRRSKDTWHVPLSLPTRKELCPLHGPSHGSRSSAFRAIRLEVRGVSFGGNPSENVQKDSYASGSLVEFAI